VEISARPRAAAYEEVLDAVTVERLA